MNAFTMRMEYRRRRLGWTVTGPNYSEFFESEGKARRVAALKNTGRLYDITLADFDFRTEVAS